MEGNQMKIRKAIEEILLICYKAGARYGYDVACGLIKSKAKKALSEPPRNCDVGTAEEQGNRMWRFCAKQKRNGIINCGYCQIKHQYERDCTLDWAQMPYEAQEGGAK